MRQNKKEVEFCRVDGKYFVTCDGGKIYIAIKNIYCAIILNNNCTHLYKMWICRYFFINFFITFFDSQIIIKYTKLYRKIKIKISFTKYYRNDSGKLSKNKSLWFSNKSE